LESGNILSMLLLQVRKVVKEAIRFTINL